MSSKKVPFNAQSNVTALKEFGFTKAQVKTILNKANQLLEQESEHRTAGRLFINYKAKPHSNILDAKVASYNRPDIGQSSMYFSSGALRLERVLETMYATETTKCVVVIHHPTVAQSKLWKTQIQPLQLNICNNFNLDVEFVEMEMWMDDISLKENIAA
jgi:hypothetical protein